MSRSAKVPPSRSGKKTPKARVEEDEYEGDNCNNVEQAEQTNKPERRIIKSAKVPSSRSKKKSPTSRRHSKLKLTRVKKQPARKELLLLLLHNQEIRIDYHLCLQEQSTTTQILKKSLHRPTYLVLKKLIHQPLKRTIRSANQMKQVRLIHLQ